MGWMGRLAWMAIGLSTACGTVDPTDTDDDPDALPVTDDTPCPDEPVDDDPVDDPPLVGTGPIVEVTYGDPSVFFANPQATNGQVVRLESFTLRNVGTEAWTVPALPLELFLRSGSTSGPFELFLTPQRLASSLALFNPRTGTDIATLDLGQVAEDADVDAIFDVGAPVLQPGESLTLQPVIDLLDDALPAARQDLTYEIPWVSGGAPEGVTLRFGNRNGLPSGAEGYVSLPWEAEACRLIPLGGPAIGPPFSQAAVRDNLAISSQAMVSHGSTDTGDFLPGARTCYVVRSAACGPVDLNGVWLLLSSGNLRPLRLTSSRVIVSMRSELAGELGTVTRDRPTNPFTVPLSYRLEPGDELCLGIDIVADLDRNVDDPQMPNHPQRGQTTGSGYVVPMGADVLTEVDRSVSSLAFNMVNVHSMLSFCDAGTGGCYSAAAAYEVGVGLSFGTAHLSYD